MPVIRIETTIHAPVEICFDLARSIELHILSTDKTFEKAVAGRTSGLMGLNETVTWRAKHFGIYQILTSKITAYERPRYFTDEMVQGTFKSLRHEHHFNSENDSTIMTDIFQFESPFGIAGKLFNKIILTNYLKKFILQRNNIIRQFAESERYKELLNT